MQQKPSYLLGVLTLFAVGFAVGYWVNLLKIPAPVPPAVPLLADADPATRLASGTVLFADDLKQVALLTLDAGRDLSRAAPARNPDGTVNVVVEIPAGTSSKWEVSKDGRLTLELRDGRPRRAEYLPYVGNYGMIPGTLLPKGQGGDGDPLDVLILGPALPRGSVARARPVGVLKFLDGGEQDDKVLAVMDDTPLAAVRSLADLDRSFPGAIAIVEQWFTNYKSPGVMAFQGRGEADEATALIDRATAP